MIQFTGLLKICYLFLASDPQGAIWTSCCLKTLVVLFCFTYNNIYNLLQRLCERKIYCAIALQNRVLLFFSYFIFCVALEVIAMNFICQIKIALAYCCCYPLWWSSKSIRHCCHNVIEEQPFPYLYVVYRANQ